MSNQQKIRVVENPYLGKEWKQVRFPKSKKKRIRNKWAKNPQNYGYVPVSIFDRTSNTLYVSSDTLRMFMQKWIKQNPDYVAQQKKLMQQTSCSHPCSPSDYQQGGKCDKNGCFD